MSSRVSQAFTTSSPIPEKLYFKIGEVAKLVGVQPHVLRYWEREVTSIRPGKTASNQRRYRRRDVEIFREIRRLLHDEKFTLAGAKKRFLSNSRSGSKEGSKNANLVVKKSPIVEELPQENEPIIARVNPALKSAQQMQFQFANEEFQRRLVKVRRGLLELVSLASD